MTIYVLKQNESILIYNEFRNETGNILEDLYEKYFKKKIRRFKKLSDHKQLLYIDKYCPQIFMIVERYDDNTFRPIYRRATESYERIIRL